MALTNKRIIDLPERASLNDDDYTVVDGANGGTGKYKLSNMQESVNDLSQAVTDHGTRLTTAEQNIETNTADITDLKEDLTHKAPVIINTSDEAEVVTLNDGADDMPMKSVVLKLVPHQEGSGDPSPSNVRPISGYTAVNVTRAGKNLLNVTATGSASSGGMTYTVNDDKTVDVSGTRTGTSYRQIGTFRGVNGVTYKFTGVPDEIADNPGPARLYLARGNTTIYATHAGATFTYLDSMGDLGIVIRTDAQISGTIRFKPMVRLASISDPTYEPYTADTYPTTLPQTLYGGEVDVAKGVLRVTWGIVDLGTLVWTYQSSTNLFFSGGFPSCKANALNLLFSNKAWVAKATQSEVRLTDKSICKDSNGRFYVHDSSYSTTADFQSAMSGSMMCYELATPTEITLDKTTIKTLFGSNTIWMDADGTIQCDYPADTKMYIDALTAPDDDMIADSNIASGKYFTVNNKLYISTSAIAQGEQIVVGTNCTQTDLATALNALNA